MANMFKSILIPLDGTDNSELVLPYAEDIAVATGADMIVISVTTSIPYSNEHLYRSYIEFTAEKLRRSLKELGAEGKVRVSGDVVPGVPEVEILRYANEKNVSLIAMAGGGRTEESPWPLGGTTTKIAHTTNKPLLVVRKRVSESVVEQGRLIKRILVPLDGSEMGEGAIPYAQALAQAAGAELVLFHVLPLLVLGPGAVGPSHEEEEARRKSAVAYLDKTARTVIGKGPKTSSVVVSGHAAEEIINYAWANHINIIAMSSHGYSGIARWALGSVTDKVLYAGDTAVLTVPASKEEG